MQLFLIRHGQSFNNALQDVTQRIHDPHLTELGERQAAVLGEYVAKSDNHDPSGGYRFTHLYCSPMLRALQTTAPIARALNMQPEIWCDIHEIGGLFTEDQDGTVTGYPGLTNAGIAERFPDYIIPDNITDKGWWNPADGLETETAAQYRALRVASALRSRVGQNEAIALVAHAGFIDRLIKTLLNQVPDVPRTIFYGHYNTGITLFDFYRQHPVLFYLNRVEHLAPELRSW